MQIVWQEDAPATVKDVLAQLHREKPLAYTTVMTVLDNLHRKGHLTRRRRGRAYEYSAARSREAHHARLMNEALDESADRSGTLLKFVGQMSPEELADLRRMLETGESSREPETR